MAIEMNLEMNGSDEDWEALKLILNEVGLHSVEAQDKFGLRASLGNGELAIGVSWRHSPRGGAIRAEGKHDCSFIVTGNATFRITSAMYDEAVATIKLLLTLLTERTNMLFVLSFQLEGVYAIRDRERGFEWFWSDPR